MQDPKRKRLALAVGAVVVCLAVILRLMMDFSGTKKIDNPNYYTGVRFNHNTGKWVTEDGKIVPPPASAPPTPAAPSSTRTSVQ